MKATCRTCRTAHPPAQPGRSVEADRRPRRFGRILIRGEYGHDIIDELTPYPAKTYRPARQGRFYAPTCSRCSTDARITQLILTGVTTEVCVHTTTREANDRGYECLVVPDRVGSYFPEFQRVGLEMVKAQGGIFGWVTESRDVIGAWPRSTPRPSRALA